MHKMERADLEKRDFDGIIGIAIAVLLSIPLWLAAIVVVLMLI